MDSFLYGDMLAALFKAQRDGIDIPPYQIEDLRLKFNLLSQDIAILHSWLTPGSENPTFSRVTVRDTLNIEGITRVGARIRRSTNQAITHNVITNVQFDTVEYDDRNYANLTADNTKLTITDSGRYEIGFYAYFQASTSANFTAQAWILATGSGASVIADDKNDPTAGSPTALSGTTDISLVAGDYLQLQVYYSDSANTNLLASAYRPAMWIRRIR